MRPAPRGTWSGSAGDQDAEVVSLFRAQYWPMVRLAALLVDDVESAEDVVQEAFLSLHRRRRSLRDPNRAADYIRSAVLNLARSNLRRRFASRRRQHELEQLQWTAPSGQPSAEQTAMLSERQQELAAALRQLPTRQREVVALRYYLDLSEGETASVLNISVGSVKQHMFRATRALRSVVGEVS
ncbi:MAG: sigma-70 family RNA polymerase sigma factor [Mycobacteriales bacterium]